MKHLLLVDPDHSSRRAIADRLRHDGHDVVETDEEQALRLYREGVEAVFVWTARDAARAARVLKELEQERERRPVLFYAPSPNDVEAPAPPAPRPELVGETTPMRDLRAKLRRLACRPSTHVVVGGEPGTGKQTLARVLHFATRSGGEYVHASPERLPELLDGGLDELRRSGGTLYVPSLEGVDAAEQRRLAALLDEHAGSGQAPLRLVVGLTLCGQLPLERVLRDAAHPDLLARLPVALELVPLRRRKSDISLLVAHFLVAWSSSSRLPRPEIAPAALAKLLAHSWPGNLRELANVIEQAALSAGATIELSDLPSFEPGNAGIDYELPKGGIDFSEFERTVLAQALELTGGNQTRAATLLGLTRDQIRYRMSKFGIARAPSHAVASES